MDWSSPDRVLDYRPVTHGRVRWTQRKNLLWPVNVWKVVAPEPIRHPLNPLQRVMLRFHLAGLSEPERAAKLLGIDPELCRVIDEDLWRRKLIDANSEVTEDGERLLEREQLGFGKLRVGWVFQDTYTGRLLPRFVTQLRHANVEVNDKGRPVIVSGTKGKPVRYGAFVLDAGDARPTRPEPRDIIDAARRHGKHEKRIQRAGIDVDELPAQFVDKVERVSDYPEPYHLLTFVYVPESPEDAQHFWYVTDPFGFGASPTLRERLERIRQNAGGGFRDIIDGMVGEELEAQREQFETMGQLCAEQAEAEVRRLLPLGDNPRESEVRNLLNQAFFEVTRLGVTGAQDVDNGYLQLRQTIEAILGIALEEVSLGEAWRKVYADKKRWAPKYSRKETLNSCAAELGFETPLPNEVALAKPSAIKWLCKVDNPSNYQVRPVLAALILAVSSMSEHPFRNLAKTSPCWVTDVNEIARRAGSEIHQGELEHDLNDLERDAKRTVEICRRLLGSLSAPKGRQVTQEVTTGEGAI